MKKSYSLGELICGLYSGLEQLPDEVAAAIVASVVDNFVELEWNEGGPECLDSGR